MFDCRFLVAIFSCNVPEVCYRGTVAAEEQLEACATCFDMLASPLRYIYHQTVGTDAWLAIS